MDVPVRTVSIQVRFRREKTVFFVEFCLEIDFYVLFFRSRGIVNGIAAALNYLFGFITKKTYYNLETALSLPGTALFYSIVCGIGLIFTYNVLPETENRSLEDIELHFADNSKNLCDRNIPKRSKKTVNCKETGDGNSDNVPKTISVVMNVANEIGHENKAFEGDDGDR